MTQDRGTGDLIDDRFRLMERLGSGAMGAVWRALDEVLQREVALKQVRPADAGLATDPDYAEMLRTRVLREARALARIDHPHVVTIHHVVVLPGEPFPWLVMELVRGGTLDDRLASGPMEPAEVAELGRGLLGALRAAHAAGICHRDVKPANVLLRPDGSPVLTDFGIADLADTSRLTVTGGLTGSPAYIAPERLHGSEGNPASDLWSLGMLLYVAVEGRHPLRQTTAAATLAAVMSGVVPAARRAGRLDPALRAVLVADPAGRATAEQVDALLLQALDPSPPGLWSGPSSASSAGSAWTGPPSAVSPSTVSWPARSIPPATPASAQSLPPAQPAPTVGSASSSVQSFPSRSAESASWTGSASDAEPVGIIGTPEPPPGEGSATVRRWPAPPPKRRSRAGVVVGSVVGGLVLLIAATVAVAGFVIVPWLRDQAELAAGLPPAGIPSAGQPSRSETPAGEPSTKTQPEAPETKDSNQGPGSGSERSGSLHTKKGMEAAIKALEEATGTTKVTKLVAYPDYAIVDVPVKGRKNAFDSYLYDKEGQVKLWTSGAGTADSTKTLDVDKIDWDLVPDLMKRADETLNLPKPEHRYLIIEAANVFADDEPTISIYLSDKYGGGHLVANLKGKILRSNPAA